MARSALTKPELERARAVLAALRDAPEVRAAVAEPRSAASVRRRLAGRAGDQVMDAFAHGPEFAAPVAAFREVQTRLRLARAAVTTDLAAVVARSRDRSADEQEGDRLRAAFETAAGKRIALRGLAPDVWAALRPGCVGVLWVLRARPAEFVDFRELSAPGGARTPSNRRRR